MKERNEGDKMKARKALEKWMVLGLLMTFLTAGSTAVQAQVVAVSGSLVNVMQEADLEAATVGQVKEGQVFVLQGITNNWCQIILPEGKQGYVQLDLLNSFKELKVTGSLVRIRQEPGLHGRILTQVTRDQILKVQDYQGGWYKVSSGSWQGWISGDYVALINPQVLTVTEEEEAAENPNPAPEEVVVEQILPGHPLYNVRPGPLAGKVIVLDPGHGINSKGIMDPGTTGVSSKNREKDINLDIVYKMRYLLENKGATVLLTHEGDKPINLYERARVANRYNTDLFISIHANASNNTSLGGHTVYYFAPNEDPVLGIQRTSRQALAENLLTSLLKAGGLNNMGARETSYVVLRETRCPSALVEVAFMSNPLEDRLLAQGGYRYRLATGLVEGIEKQLIR